MDTIHLLEQQATSFLEHEHDNSHTLTDTVFETDHPDSDTNPYDGETVHLGTQDTKTHLLNYIENTNSVDLLRAIIKLMEERDTLIPS